MALKKAIGFQLRVQTDGTSTTVSAAFATAPFILGVQQAGEVSVVFSLAVTPPSDIDAGSLTSESGIAVTASILLGVVTFTYASAPPAGLDALHGTFAF